MKNNEQFDEQNIYEKKLIVLVKDWAGLNLSGRAVYRGGNWDNGADAGLFTANMNNAPSDSNTNIGFRCCNSFQSQIHYFYGNNEQCRKTTSIQIQAVFYQLNIKTEKIFFSYTVRSQPAARENLFEVIKNSRYGIFYSRVLDNQKFAASRMKPLLIKNCKFFLRYIIDKKNYIAPEIYKVNFLKLFYEKESFDMKTHKNLFENITSFENIYNAYLKAKKGKSGRKEVLKFTYNLENELFKLQKELIDGEYKLGKYRKFIIFEPKKREISALPFRDRVVQHAICNIIEPIFEKKFIFDSYACRKNKGTHAALNRLQGFLNKENFVKFKKTAKLSEEPFKNSLNNGQMVNYSKFSKENFYVLKCDVKSYFPSINHDVLKKIIRKKISDERLLNILGRIIDSSKDGLPIGNLTSQLFANIYLNEMDYFIKHKLRIKFYLRYMDDFIILHEDKKMLYIFKRDIVEFLDLLKLKMHETKARIFPCKTGIDFLGYVIFRDYRRVRKRTVKRAMKKIKYKIKKYDKSIINFYKLMESANSFDAYLNHANTYALKKTLKQKMKNIM